MSRAVLLQQVSALIEGKLDLFKKELVEERRTVRLSSSAPPSREQSRSRRSKRKGVVQLVGSTIPAAMPQAGRTRGSETCRTTLTPSSRIVPNTGTVRPTVDGGHWA
ncbi:hypothetical protein KM043_013410 [Ampulex compressa]|nr:hypothetical protein KM043_013410 [Ampulex compressa]